jgi:hypothetical protein
VGAPAVTWRTRLAAWLLTGPIGHLVGGALDVASLLRGYLWARVRGRDPWRPPE